MDEYTAMEESYKNGYDKGYADAKGELVLCKDCKHRYTFTCGKSCCEKYFTFPAKDNDFCSYGERREGE